MAENVVARESAQHTLRHIFEQATCSPSVKRRCAVTGLSVGVVDLAAELVRLDADPSPRTDFIHNWSDWPCDTEHVIELLSSSSNGALRSAICCALGNCTLDAFGTEESILIAVMKNLYREAPDAATHSASGWALRRWQLEVDPQHDADDQLSRSNDQRDWSVNSQGMTMLRIPAGSFLRDEVDVKLSEFWLSDRPVSVGQFLEFASEKTSYDWQGHDEEISPTRAHPVQRVSWYDASEYCNWLSAREGLRPVYEPGTWAEIPDSNGYRLPTEAEWEYACRAGSITEYCLGNDPELLPEYAVYRAITTAVCASKLPNGWGLFDMHGNVLEWCRDWYSDYTADPSTASESSRVLRGGSFDCDYPRWLRSAGRGWFAPGDRDDNIGFRLSRTP